MSIVCKCIINDCFLFLGVRRGAGRKRAVCWSPYSDSWEHLGSMVRLSPASLNPLAGASGSGSYGHLSAGEDPPHLLPILPLHRFWPSNLFTYHLSRGKMHYIWNWGVPQGSVCVPGFYFSISRSYGHFSVGEGPLHLLSSTNSKTLCNA